MLSIFMMPFVIKAFFCGIIIGSICACYGIFVTINKMAFFSESVSHSSIAAAAFALWLGMDVSIFTIFFSLAVASAIALVSQSSISSKDSVIGIIHSTTIAVGIIILSFLSGGNNDISKYLFGDILAITNLDIWLCTGLFAASSLYLLKFGRTHMITCITPEFSIIEGISVKFYDFLMMLILAFIIALSVKIVGAILVTALLIIPSNASKNIAKSFKSFAIMSFIFGALSAVLGIAFSVAADLPAGPAVIVVNALFYFLTFFMRSVFNFGI